MTDYDGIDHAQTIINALNWTGAGLTEPTYYEKHTYKNVETPYNLLFEENDITPERISDGTIHWRHNLNIEFHYATKATAWTALEFIVKSLNIYTNGTKYIDPNSIRVGVRYTETRKIFILNCDLIEVKSVT